MSRFTICLLAFVLTSCGDNSGKSSNPNQAPDNAVVWTYEIALPGYHGGKGDQESAAKQAIDGVKGLDNSRTEFDANSKILTIRSQPDKVVAMQQVLAKLRKAGFKTGRFRGKKNR